jgi:hypothetical protein
MKHRAANCEGLGGGKGMARATRPLPSALKFAIFSAASRVLPFLSF